MWKETVTTNFKTLSLNLLRKTDENYDSLMFRWGEVLRKADAPSKEWWKISKT
jgi:hypothetical protein